MVLSRASSLSNEAMERAVLENSCPTGRLLLSSDTNSLVSSVILHPLFQSLYLYSQSIDDFFEPSNLTNGAVVMAVSLSCPSLETVNLCFKLS